MLAGTERCVLVVGAGLSGCAAAWAVREQWQREEASSNSSPRKKLDLHVWDGARGCGGRLATARIDVPGSEKGQQQAKANMGAQRLHVTAADGAAAAEAAKQLAAAGVVRDCGLGCLEPTSSSNSVCRWFLERSGATLKFGARVRSISHGSGGGWEVAAFGDKRATHFDAVIFAGSVAEVFTTHGDFDNLVSPSRPALSRVGYSRACCAALVFHKGGGAEAAIKAFFGGQRSVKADGTVLEELVLQQPEDMARKDVVVVVAVSSEDFGASVKGLRATHRPSAEDRRVSAEVLATLTAHACTTIATHDDSGPDGQLASLMGKSVVASKMNYWKFSRVTRTFESKGTGCVECLTPAPLIAVVGDYFAGSPGFGGCVRSAASAAMQITVGLMGRSSAAVIGRSRP